MKVRISLLAITGVALVFTGYEISQALLVRSTTPDTLIAVHPEFGDQGTDETKFPLITVEYSKQYYSDIDSVKFRVGWGPQDFPVNFIILKHEKEGWYSKNILLTDSDWSAQFNTLLKSSMPNYIILAIRPDDVFGEAVAAADKCKAMHTNITAQEVVMFQCRYL
jgi:hypothetical protein